MLIDETLLAPFRGEDGLCRLQPDRVGPYRYADYPKLLAKGAEMDRQPNLMRDGAIKIVSTWDCFKDLSDRVDHGVVAMFAYTRLVPVLPVTRSWIAFQHQAAGYLNRQVSFIGTAINPRPTIKSAFGEIARKNFGACGGHFDGPTADPATTEEYLADIAKLGLSCSGHARSELCESVYPIDATPNALSTCFEDIGDLAYLAEDAQAKPLIMFLSANSD